MNDLAQTRAETWLREAEAASEDLLDALTDEVAVIDASGHVIAVNEAWKRFAQANGDEDLCKTSVGQNYLAVCRNAAASGDSEAQEALQGITEVLRGQSSQFSMEYECSSSAERRWFRLVATSLAHLPGALIKHRNITEQRRYEEALRLSGEAQGVSPVLDLFLPALVKNLATALDVQHAFLSELIDATRGRARLLSHWAGDGYGPLREYDVIGIPAEQVLTGRMAVYPSGIQNLFPESSLLKEMEAESYMAVPLLDSAGDLLGYLSVVDTKPLKDPSFAETTLKVFAARATPGLERMRIERQLADQSRLIDSVPIAVVGTDENFVVTYWNKAAEETYGWTAEEAAGRDVREILQTEMSDEERAERARVTMKEGVLRSEVTQHRKDGSAVEIAATTMAFRSPDGDVKGFISVNRDVTEPKLAEQALRESESRYRALLEAVPDMMFTLDRNGRYLSFTPARNVQPLFPPEHFLGRLVEEVMPPDLSGPIMKGIEDALRSGQTDTFEYRLVENEVPKDYEARIVPIDSDEVLAIVRDISSRKQSEEGRTPAADQRAGYLESHRLTRPRGRACILIVDQDLQALRFLKRSLEQSGGEPLVTGDADEAIRLAELESPDLILLDMMLPDERSFDVLREIRPLTQAQIVVLVTGEREETALEALRLGADDYITKPISPAALSARIEAALRRGQARRSPEPSPIDLGRLTLDPATRLVSVDGTAISLTPTEYRLLYQLATSAGRVLTHDEILERVWGAGYAGQHELLRSFVRTLRRKLGDDPREPCFIRSERGVGYRMLKAESQR
jgi:PAS domain S-box-containing protein